MTPDNTAWSLSTDFPIALLPVGLETRFASGELWVRIFPEPIHVDTHEPGLTGYEVEWGKRFWEDLWRSGRVEADEVAAWERLATHFGPERAAWIARVLEPPQRGRPNAPVPPRRALPVAQEFPRVGRKREDAAWTRAPRALALPTRWHAIGTLAGEEPTQAVSNDVSTPLVVGPSPELDLAMVSDDQPPVDEATRWMVDFDAALEAGMALKVPLTERMAERGLDRLVVFGVSENLDERAAENLLTGLLEAQFHTQGLGFVPQGTPSNNTEEAPSGYDPHAPEHVRTLRVAHGDKPPSEPESNARAAARALGLALSSEAGDGLHDARGGAGTASPRALARAYGAGIAEQADSRAMNAALWAATWGYFLWQMLYGNLSDEAIEHGRRHFVAHVRASGPLPALRVGEQPYGLLPVTSLDLWKLRERDALDETLLRFLRRLRNEVWLPSSENVARVHSGRADTQETLLRILSSAPTSTEYRARSMLGMEYVGHLWRFLRLRLDDSWREVQAEDPRRVLDLLGLEWNPRVAGGVFASHAFLLQAQLIEEEAPTTGAKDYLEWLASPDTDWVQIRARADLDSPEAGSPLLYLLLRHGMLTEYAFAAYRAQSVRGLLPPGELPEPELVDIGTDGQAWTLWRQLERPVRVARGRSRPLGEHLQHADPRAEPAVADLAAFRAALKHLAERPPDLLARLLSETLDLASHRLDAWLTSFATKRLWWLRGRAPQGVHLGGYGWLVDLRPRSAREFPVPVTDPPPGEEPPPGTTDLFTAPFNAGFIHAPSLLQAATAAVLRSGWRAHGGEDGSPLAIDLSSRRVRLASWLLDGVRQGQPLETLLGYRFERELHEHPLTLDGYIPRLRELAPVRGNLLNHDGSPKEVIAATNIVDGLKLHRLWKEGSIDWQGDTELPDPGEPDQSAILEILTSLDDAIDAVGDALLCESVHQAVQGNPLRAGATLDAASWGEAPPPELESLRTPRTGVAITHRLLFASNSRAADPTEWPTDGRQARAHAEPTLNALAAGLLPAPRRVMFRANWLKPDGGETDAELRLDSLRCSPLDYVYMSDFDDDPQGSEFYGRMAAAAHDQARVHLPEGSRLRLDFEPREPGLVENVSVTEFMEMARAVRELVVSAKAMNEADLASPGVAAEIGDDDRVLAERADVAVAALASVSPLLGASGEDTVREGLLRAAAFGVPGAFSGGTNPVEHAASVRADVAQRLAAVQRLTDGFDRSAATPAARRAHDVDRLQEVFGPEFRVLPPFRVANSDELRAALAASDSLQGGDPLEAATWLQRASKVRAGADRLQTARTYAEVVRGESGARLVVAQLPYSDGDRWLALKGDGTQPPGGRLSLVICGPSLDLALPVAGIVADEWVEVVPSDQESTGIAFHFDAPNARAPQAILLAVTPDAAPTWKSETLAAILSEALDLVKVRAVDPDELEEVGQFLPALYFALNVDGDTASTDFTKAARS